MNETNLNETISKTSDFINGANQWGATSLMVYVTLFIVAIVCIMFFISNKNAKGWTDYFVNLQRETTQALQNNTVVMGKVLDTFKEHNALLSEVLRNLRDNDNKLHANGQKLMEHSAKLNEILNTIKEIKENFIKDK